MSAAERSGAYLRLTTEPLSSILGTRVSPVKSAFLSRLGRPLEREARRRGIAGNRGFRGVRSFTERAPFRTLFRRMINAAPAGTLIMCHPGRVDAVLESRDPLTFPREAEYNYLASDEFPADLAAAGLRLARLSEI